MLKRFNINLPEEVYEKLRQESFSKKKSISKVILEKLNGLSYSLPVTPTISSIKCDYDFCKSMSEGKFRVGVPDSIEGTVTLEKYLCTYHRARAKREGQVVTL